MFRWLFAWLTASLATYVTGSVFMTQVVLGDVASFGIDVDAAEVSPFEEKIST